MGGFCESKNSGNRSASLSGDLAAAPCRPCCGRPTPLGLSPHRGMRGRGAACDRARLLCWALRALRMAGVPSTRAEAMACVARCVLLGGLLQPPRSSGSASRLQRLRRETRLRARRGRSSGGGLRARARRHSHAERRCALGATHAIPSARLDSTPAARRARTAQHSHRAQSP